MGIIVVAQATGQHGWSSLESYVAGLHELGKSTILHRPQAPWGASRLTDDDGLISRLRSGLDEPVLLCGFDWHSQPLHNDPSARDALLAHRGPRIGIFQEHLAAEWIRRDAELARLFDGAALSACDVLTHVACNHEGDVQLLRGLGVRLPILFLPFFADLQTFQRTRPMSQRDPRAFFRGKQLEFKSSSPYAAREMMAARLRGLPHAIVADLAPASQLDRDAMIAQYVEDLNRYRIQLNLPSVSDSLTCRPFEVMACGGALVQTAPSGELSQRLLPRDSFAVIDRNRPESVVERVDELRSQPKLAEAMAELGYADVLAHHGAGCRLSQLLGWVAGSLTDAGIYRELTRSKQPRVSASMATPSGELGPALATPQHPRRFHPRILVDLVFYQRANTGIAQVWNRLLSDWADMGYAQFVVLALRHGSACQPPPALMQRFETVELRAHGGPNDEQLVQSLCDRVGATLFMSTYYTRPISTRSLLLIHDCIPERLNPDCHAEEVWREKQRAIETAAAYACISETTARDLRCIYEYSVGAKPVYVIPNEFPNRFEPAPESAVTAFVRRNRLKRQYIVFVGERVGYRGYKNVECVCAALYELAAAAPELAARYSLLFTGGAELGDALTVEPALERHLAAWHVRRVTLDDTDMTTALSGAAFAIYPSLMEGFGLPPGEAAMCGTPTIVWDTPINREVYKDGLAYLRDGDAEEMGQQIAEWLEDTETWRNRALELGGRLRDLRAERGGASQSGTLLECALLHAQRSLDVAAPDYVPVLFDAHPTQREEWLDRLLLAHPTCRTTGDLSFGREALTSAAIVSMYRGERFVAGCVDDLVEQTAFESGDMEVILVDSASPQDERRLVTEQMARHRNLLYVRSVDRESLYRAWNRGACISRARYLSNANLDDRHRKDFFERLAGTLDARQDVELVYPAQYLTSVENEHFRQHAPVRSWGWPEYSLDQLRIGNHVGSQPMWRRSLHQRIGWFEERYRIAGDYDFWCRIAHRAGPLLLYPVHVGLYYFNGAGIEHGDPLRSEWEVSEICRLYGISKNYETSDADRERATRGSAVGERRLEDLQYSGVPLTHDINVWVDATRGIARALAVADSVLSQSVATHHRMRVVFVNPTWSSQEAARITASVLAPLTREFRAECRRSEVDFPAPESCTILVHGSLGEDNSWLQRRLRAFYEGGAQVESLNPEGAKVGFVARRAAGLLEAVEA